MMTLEQQIAFVRATGLVDEAYYLNEYPDVGLLKMNPAEHYVRIGACLLRNPSRNFDTQSYFKSHPGIDSLGINPLVHFAIKTGTAKRDAAGIIADGAARVEAELTKLASARVKGFVDKLDATGVSGWAIDRARPGQFVELSIYVDDAHLMDIRTSAQRNDVTAAGMQGEKAGFAVNWPAGLLRPGAVVDVRHKIFNTSLSRSPKTLDGSSTTADRRLTYLEAYRERRILPVTVVVPIFNALDAVVECVRSLEKHVSDAVNVLLINDCSTDPEIAVLLKRYLNKKHFQVHHNVENLGYTRTVNKAISMCDGRDVVLLNSDTVVTDRWLHNLRYCAYSDSRVATVTAVSDNAGAFSIPDIGKQNLVPQGMSPEQFALAITHASEGRLLEVPTGNGFCMYIRRSVLAAIGAFDEERFPRGYGEENDFCMRAYRSGWKNIVCDKAYVFHKRSQSFQGEKVHLMEAGAKAVNTAFPEYRLLTQRFSDAEFALVRSRARTAVATDVAHSPLPRTMYVISTQTGGTPQTNMDLMRSMKGKYECFLLRCDSKTITLSKLINEKLHLLETHALSRAIDPVTHRSDEYDRVVLDMLYRHSISLLHIRHIGWHSMGLSTAAKSVGVPVVYSSHDFYAVCPSLNLLDENLKYCGGKCTAGEGTCQIALWPTTSIPPLKHRFISRWREMFGEFLRDCDSIITTATSSAEILLSAYPDARSKLRVIPHGREFKSFASTSTVPQENEKVRVLVPGNISLSKGAKLIKDIADLDTVGRLEFHFLGEVTWPGLAGVGIHHGKYDRDSFTAAVGKISPHFGVVLSIWPETYCHTLTEMWACGVPVFGINIGAVGDRLLASGAGWLLEPGATAEQVLTAMLKAVDDRKDFIEKIEATQAWQRTEGVWNDTGSMAVEYRASYSKLLEADKAKTKRIGLIIKGTSTHPATAHIRVLRPLSVVATRQPIDIRPVTAAWVLAGGLERIDALVVQRDAVPPELTTVLIDKLKAQNLPFIYEVDDWLWNLPVDHTDHQITEEHKVSMLALAKAATVVTTSTDKLAEVIRERGCNVQVIPNGLDEALWLKPLPSGFVGSVGEQNGLLESKPRILYMGTKSHASDLEIIIPGIKRLIAEFPDVEIIQIGGGRLLPGAKELKVPAAFSQYPDFVQWFRAVCSFARLALAPLRDDEFNSAKSDIKTLDYGLGLVPAIFSDVGPYKRSIENGGNGILCRNSPDEWYEAIKSLLNDAPKRQRLATSAFERALERGLGAELAEEWAKTLLSLFPEARSENG